MNTYLYKGGSATKSMKKYAKIADYLELHYRGIYDLIDNLAMLGSLIPRSGGGITFIIPDKPLQKKITDLVNGSEPELATDIVYSLILPDCYKSAHELVAKKDSVRNLYNRLLPIEGIEGEKVKLKGGATLIPDKEYTPFKRVGTSIRDNTAIWQLAGSFDYESFPKAAPFPAAGPKMRTKSAIAIPLKGGNNESSEVREFIRKTTEAEVSAIRYKSMEGGRYKSPLITVVAAVLRGFVRNLDFNSEATIMGCIMTQHPVIDFYLLFQAPNFINPSRSLEAYHSVEHDNFDLKTVGDFWRGSESLFPRKSVIQNAINEIKKEMPIDNGAGARITEIYRKLDADNCIEYAEAGIKIENIYPEVFASKLRGLPTGSHLALDESKYFIHSAVQKIRPGVIVAMDDTEGRAKLFAEFFDEMRPYRLGDPAFSTILRPDIIQKSSGSEWALGFLRTFWMMFGLHMPFSGAAGAYWVDRLIKGGNEEMGDETPQYDNNTPFQISRSALNELRAYVSANHKYPDIATI